MSLDYTEIVIEPYLGSYVNILLLFDNVNKMNSKGHFDVQ